MTATTGPGSAVATVPAASGLAARTPEDWQEIKRVFRVMIAGKKANDAQVDAVILASKALGCNPVLGHVDLIEGRVYLTHKGLWHLAHQSGVLDGIEIKEQGETEGYYTACVAIYRKDMKFPFTYAGRYPREARNSRYGPEMALVRAECMALRRAFDVNLPVVEEINWPDGREYAAPAVPEYTVEVAEPAAPPAHGADHWPDERLAAYIANAGNDLRRRKNAVRIYLRRAQTPEELMSRYQGLAPLIEEEHRADAYLDRADQLGLTTSAADDIPPDEPSAPDQAPDEPPWYDDPSVAPLLVEDQQP